MMRVAVLGYLWALLCALLVFNAAPQVEGVCTLPRIRKSYDQLTLTERQVYRSALQLAMDKGLYIKFVEMHMEKMSEMEAHRVCMFTYWHRYFLLGFENMLRSLGPQYECVTIPFWDEMQHNARALTGACKNIEQCSPIVQEMGGSAPGISRAVTINGAYVTGDTCVNRAPLDHFCEASSKSGSKCARCLPRGNLRATTFPSATNFASVYRQLFMSGNFVSTGKNIEDGMHNAMHAIAGGAMSTFQSPADPLFWSHHAYVDLLLTVYLKCRVGLGRMTDQQKQNDPYAFVQCPHREDAGMFTSSSTITMRAGENGLNPKQVNQPGQVLYPYFKDLPSRFYQLADVTQLGANRYIYQIGGLVGQMGVRCDATTANRRLMSASRNTTTRRRRLGCKSDLSDGDEVTDTPEDAPLLPEGLEVVPVPDPDGSIAKVNDWVDEVRRQLREASSSSGAAPNATEEAHQMEKMVCSFYDQCRGGIEDYSEQFKRDFHVTEPPPCKRILEDMRVHNTTCNGIKLPDWKGLMEKYFPCSIPDAAYGSSF